MTRLCCFLSTLCCCVLLFHTILYSQTETNYVDSEMYEFIDDGAWCWFQDERAVVDADRGKLIIGTANMRSGVDLIIFDINSKRVESTRRFGGLAYPDDHNSPGIVIAPNGNYVALWAHHYDQYNTRYSIYNGQEWSAEKRYDWTTMPGGTDFTICYSNVYYLSAEQRMYNFARANDRAPNFIYSDDNGNTWRFGGQITTNEHQGYNRGYYKYWGNGVDRIDIVLTEAHPREMGTSIFHGYIKDHKLYNTEGKVGNHDIYNRGQMAHFSDFTRVFAHGTVFNGVTMGRCWQHDLVRYDDGTIAILFKARANNSETDHRNFYSRYDGNGWKTTYIGKAGTKMYDSEQDYTGLGALCPDDPDRIYISSPFNPGDDNSRAGKREIWRGTTTNDGATWSWEAVTANSTEDNFRPIVPKWEPGREALLWFRGSYETAQRFYSKVVGTFYEYDAGDGFRISVGTSGQGTVTRSPDMRSYPEGTTVTLTAVPLSGWEFLEWSGAGLSGNDTPVTVTMNENKSIRAIFIRRSVDGNLVTNGDFSSGTDSWTLNVWGGSASGSVINGEYRIDISTIGTTNYQIQLIQPGLYLENGKTYQVSFDAYAASNRTLEVNVELDVDPWTSYLPEVHQFNLSTSRQTFTFTFTMGNQTDFNGRLSFNAGASTENVYIDNVSVKETSFVSVSRGGGSKRLQDVRVSSKSSESRVEFIAPGTGKTTLNLYNLKGTLVRTATLRTISGLNYSHSFDLTGSSGGFYILKISSEGNAVHTSKLLLTR